MIRPNYTVCVTLFLFSYFSYAKITYRIPTRVYFPIKNLTDELLVNKVDMFNRSFFTNAVKYDIQRVNVLSDKKYIRNLQVLNFLGLVKRYDGYTASTHLVKSNGYNLKIHRLQNALVTKTQVNEKKPVVYIQHGLFMSSDCFVLQGPNKDLAFILADAGFDVWIGNARGNTYSRSHDSLLPNDSDFWDFTFDQIGKQDIAAFIEKIIEVTKVEKLDFIGYQLGATEGFIYATYNMDRAINVIRLFIAIHPFVYWSNNDSEVLSVWSWNNLAVKPLDNKKSIMCNNDNSISYIRDEIERTAYSELYPQSRFFGITLPYFCEEIGNALCMKIIESFYGSHASVNESMYVDILKHFPAGVSKKMILHLLDNIESGGFHTVNSGWWLNNKYDLSKVTVPVVIYDKESPNSFVQLLDYNKLFDKLPNPVINLINEDLDILWPNKRPVVFQNHLVDLLTNYES